MRGSASLPAELRGNVVRLCLTLCIAAGVALQTPAHTQAQTPATALPLLLPSAIAFDAQGNLYFAETGNHVVRKLSAAGAITIIAGNGVQGFAGDNGPATAAELDSPTGLALDSAGNLYIADTHNHRVREVSAATGTIATIAGTGVAGLSGDKGPATAAQLALPTALATDTAGDLYVADTRNQRIRRIAAATGVITTFAGNGVEGFSGDNGPATAASIDSPSGLALDAAGNLYLADTHNARVREVSAATGLISTVAGVGGPPQAFSGDGGPATAAGLALPRGLTIDAAGNLYLADSANHRIRRISPSGVITTVAGQGMETFAGDGAPAIAASLDTPRSVAISPIGLLTLADTENQRIRQLDSLPAPGPDIHTIAGLGTALGNLTLSAPSVVVYGSGIMTAALTASTNATGSVTFLDTSNGGAVTLGSASLAADAASFSTAALSAGAHSLVAVYAGDATHPAAQSAALAMTVTPLALIATANPALALYGQSTPTLTGTLNGVLAQDAGKVAAVFTTVAATLSPVGLYPIAAALTGTAAGNYTLATAPVVDLSIAQAPTLTTLSTSANNPSLGLAVTLTTRAASTTSGVPTGSITLLDGVNPLSVLPLTAGGAAFSTSALTLGSHNLSAAYSGDPNFLPSTSAIANVVVGVASDFSLAATGSTTQSVPAGSAATFNFAVAMTGTAMASPITLAVQGLPLGATPSFSPNYLPPGGAITSFTLTIQTPFAGMDRRTAPPPRNGPGSSYPALAVLMLPVFGFLHRRTLKHGNRVRSLTILAVAIASCALLATFATGCGDRVNTASESINATTYTITVTGTATGPTGSALVHSANVTLAVL